jgi:hypothetical protein
MKNPCRVFFLISFALMLSCAAIPQQVVPPPPKPAGKQAPPPPKPADDGPSLESTMKFIQTKLNELDKISYAIYVHNSASNFDRIKRITNELSNVRTDPISCQVSYHWKTTVDGDTTLDKDAWFSLGDVQDLVVETGEAEQKRVDAGAGYTARSYRFAPPVFALVVRGPGKEPNALVFAKEDIANRVAKAMMHAVELCGGENKDPS